MAALEADGRTRSTDITFVMVDKKQEFARRLPPSRLPEPRPWKPNGDRGESHWRRAGDRLTFESGSRLRCSGASPIFTAPFQFELIRNVQKQPQSRRVIHGITRRNESAGSNVEETGRFSSISYHRQIKLGLTRKDRQPLVHLDRIIRRIGDDPYKQSTREY